MEHKDKFATLAVPERSLLLNTPNDLCRTMRRVTGAHSSKVIQFNLNRWVLFGIFMLACLSTAHAQDIWAPSQEYDTGYNPSVAISGTTVVEVHNGQNNYGPMWYHVGQQNPSTGAVTWGPSYNYGNGYNPTVAISGTTVVEVHNGQLGYGPMWYHVGQVNGSTITWGPRYGFGSGYNPTIALAPYQGTIVNRDCLLAIEAHNSSSSTTANMYYKVGPVGSVSECEGGPRTNPSVIHFGPATYYDWGWNPSVAAAPCQTSDGGTCGVTILEVHNGHSQAGAMWYHVGTWTGGSTIAWGASNNYDSGYNPKVAFANVGTCGGGAPTYLVVEVHNGSGSAGDMWSHIGFWNGGTTIYLNPAAEYDSGWNPTAAVVRSGYTVVYPVEVHDGSEDIFGTAPIPLWYHVGAYGWCIP